MSLCVVLNFIRMITFNLKLPKAVDSIPLSEPLPPYTDVSLLFQKLPSSYHDEDSGIRRQLRLPRAQLLCTRGVQPPAGQVADFLLTNTMVQTVETPQGGPEGSHTYPRNSLVKCWSLAPQCNPMNTPCATLSMRQSQNKNNQPVSRALKKSSIANIADTFLKINGLKRLTNNTWRHSWNKQTNKQHV